MKLRLLMSVAPVALLVACGVPGDRRSDKVVSIQPAADWTPPRTAADYEVPWDYYDWGPDWSPDGNRLAFAGREDTAGDEWRLVELDIQSGERKVLTETGTHEVRPQYSSDGDYIMFSSHKFGETLDVALYNLKTAGVERIEIPGTDTLSENRPVWSPAGDAIYFDAVHDGEAADIYRFTFDTGELETIIGGAGNQRYARVSPDGSKLLYRDDIDGDPELYLLSLVDGSKLRLTDNDVLDQAATWSPDGAYITYFSQETGDPEIFVSRPDGSEKLRLTHSVDWDFMPVFSPDGKQIAFDSRRTGRRSIYVMDADGGNARQQTNHARSALIADIEARGADTAIADYEKALGDGAFLKAPFTHTEAGVLVDALIKKGAYRDALRLTDLWAGAFPWRRARDDSTDVALSDALPHLQYRAARTPSVHNLLMLGLAETKLSQSEAAKATFEKVLRLDPDNELARQGLDKLAADGAH